MDRAGRRRRHDGVDPLAAHDPDRCGDRGEVPGHARVGQEQPASGDLRLQEQALEPLGDGELLGRLPRPRPDVADAVHPGLRRHAQVGIAVHPLRVVGSEHVGLDPERGQVLRELQRPLHAAAARGREVQRDEEHLHGAKRRGRARTAGSGFSLTPVSGAHRRERLRAAAIVASISASPCALERNHASNCDGREVDAAVEHRAVERGEALRVGQLRVLPAPDRRLGEEEARTSSRPASAAPRLRPRPPRRRVPSMSRSPARTIRSHTPGSASARSVSIPAVIASGFPESVPAW